MKTKADIRRARQAPVPESVRTLLQHLNSSYFAETDLPWSLPDNTDPVGDRLSGRREFGIEAAHVRADRRAQSDYSSSVGNRGGSGRPNDLG
jgi:hypothetical protein